MIAAIYDRKSHPKEADLMNRDDALALHAELEELAAMGPGGITDSLRNRLQQIELTFRMAGEPDSYLREKVWHACHDLEIWLSPRKWQQWGPAGSYQGLVNNSVYKVRLAINARFPDPLAPHETDTTP